MKRKPSKLSQLMAGIKDHNVTSETNRDAPVVRKNVDDPRQTVAIQRGLALKRKLLKQAISVDWKSIPCLEQVLVELGDDDLISQLIFLLLPRQSFCESTAVESLLAGDVEQVLAAARISKEITDRMNAP